MNKTYFLSLISIVIASSMSAQTVSLDNGKARMDLKLNGGTITEFSLNAVDVNPIHEYGHFICFDRWGPSSPEDLALGIPFHGEASKVKWTLHQEAVARTGYHFTEMSCFLPIVKLGMNRKIYLDANSSVFKVVEEIVNHNDAPKVFNLVQHPTIGAPFLDQTTIVDTKVDSGFSQAGTLPPTPEEVLKWPDAVVDGDSTDLRYLAGDHTWDAAVVSFTQDEDDQYGWVTAVNPSLNLMVGYLWDTSEYPWLNLWFNLRNNKPFARGLEFGSTGLHQPWPTVLEMDSILGKKLYEELDVDEKVTKSYYAFLSEIPSDYKGVESVSISGEVIKVEEYGAHPDRSIELEIAGILAAETEVMVIKGGASHGGGLETTINGDTTDTGERAHPNRIYELEAGEVYHQYGPIVVDHPEGTITIRGQDGGAKPVILKDPQDEMEIGTNLINSSLTIQNVQYHAMQTDGAQALSCWEISGDNHHLLLEDCLIEHCDISLFDLNQVQSGAEIVIRNSYFRDLNAFDQWWAARIVECKVPVDTFIFENNTVSGGGLTILGQECLFDYSVINHNTFINNHKYPFLNQYWKEVYFTNNLFVNANMVGEDMENVLTGGSDPDVLPKGIVGVDEINTHIRIQGKYLNTDSTALTAEVDEISDIIFYAADNVVTYSSSLDNYYDGTVDGVWDDAPASYLTWGGMEGPFKVINVPGMWVNERTRELITGYNNIVDKNNSIYEMTATELGLVTNPLPQDAADLFVQWNRVQWDVPEVALPTDYSAYYFGDNDPNTIPGVETEDSDAGGITRISDLIEDFSFTANLVSQSDGLRIGALHWNDEAFDSEASLSLIKAAYTSTVLGISDPMMTPELVLTNFPNPFTSSTTIRYSLPSESHVKLVVYDISGRIISTLVDTHQPAGLHVKQFTPDQAVASTCYCILATDYSTVTRKMVLLY